MVLEQKCQMAIRQYALVYRRLIQEEVIPNEEKVHSLNAPPTRWIVKGKAGVPFELGVPLAILESLGGMVLGCVIMWEGTDVDVAVPLVKQWMAQYPTLDSVSFDRGFYSKRNRDQLEQLIPRPVLPKRGRLSQADRLRETDPKYVELRRLHVAVESRINSLEQHGCDRIRTKGGRDGFERTVWASVVATNLCQIGRMLIAKERARLRAIRQAA